MSKSAGNFITLEQLFNGDHPLLEKGFDPMVARFLMLQSHYRSKIDFSNEALVAAEKGYQRLMDTLAVLDEIEFEGKAVEGKLDSEIERYCDDCYNTMSDDFNTAKALAALFELSSKINGLYHGQINGGQLSQKAYNRMEGTFRSFTTEVLGLNAAEKQDDSKTDQLVELLIDMRARARARKDFDTADKIRDRLAEIGIQLKDDKSGKTTYKIQT